MITISMVTLMITRVLSISDNNNKQNCINDDDNGDDTDNHRNSINSNINDN